MLSRSKTWKARLYRWFYLSLSLISLSLVLLIQPATAKSPEQSAPTTAQRPDHRAAINLAAGRNLYQAGRFTEAVVAWQAASEQYHRHGDAHNAALSLSYLASAQQELSQWDLAKQSIDRSLKQLKTSQPQPPSILWAQVLNNQAQLLFNTGQSETALKTWEQAESYYHQADDAIGQIGTQINQAHALQKLGFYRRARQQLEALGQDLAKQSDRQVQISGLQAIGNAWQNSGNYRAAEDNLTKALELARQLGDKPKQSTILLNLGQVAMHADEPNTAIEDFEEAEKLAHSDLRKVQAQVRKLRLMVEYQRPDLAADVAPKLQQALSQLPKSQPALYSAINFASSMNRLSHSDKALPPAQFNQFMEQTVKAAQQIGDPRAEAYALSQWAQGYEQHQQWTTAEKLTQASLRLARQVNAPEIISQSAWQLGTIQKQHGAKQAAIQSYEEAISSLRSIRGDLIATNPDIQFSFRESVEPVYRELVDLLLDNQPSQSALKQSRDLIESLQLAELDNFFREACIDQVQQIDQLDPKATVVYPIMLPDRLAVILSQAGQPLRYYVTSKPQAKIDRILSDGLAALNPVTGVGDREIALETLYDLLIRPAEQDQAFKQTETLVFVLDGKLRNIPMSALYDRQSQQYLIEKYAVTLSPGMQLLTNQALEANQLKAIIAGISESRSGFTALPAVEQEVQRIADRVGSSPLVNQSFTSQALAQQVQDPENSINVVHLATHGQFSSNLEDTFLLTWDGHINIKELSELLKAREGKDNEAINLLVLSACDTAIGDDRSVLGLAGLAVKSGARSTVASLWPVRDQVAAQLMEQFYDNLKQTDMNKAEALRQAQIQLIRQTDFKHPFFWSPFVMVGHWQ
ncbi:CHAT domain-containing protein [filamentous cyanobacterium LEGE 11480]|uniref:CHAT domain-containing protein n=1 Tax=Romeriopsis navalis LEGE 11480 TaxID=2777977 RepID=A0A928Z4Q8_9CYAN|nr:CHAT domain-containing protein [Romeriopsis navalis]MBE9031277.1 CHAT domain-containing protein [Romeriopsis navalis LEGE 11480]